ncbi:G/U mismatch-specific DNA glycosylase [Cryptosporangium arvum]|uniref:G:T/U mismatch-specific DNA glycosylase n=1 Tax=Cryptosporangium arvum DSM 44712 TaxID=927661 RepID=A0A010ZPF1_9ACTN|nr:G/U mismatch-specific DNA glycosylase [Cryptosporangium arvum]EXG79107.1 G:T/U mismatch-specific DNA glycosylase [Cryptosporangium arvum DSM 44712]
MSVARPGGRNDDRRPTPRSVAGTRPEGGSRPEGPGTASGRPRRPTKADLQAAYGQPIADTVGPGLRVLFCGINPSLWSGWSGHHFARPGNRFWPALHRSGFTPRQLDPSESDALLALDLGVTNLVNRATARADELSPEELLAGGERLVATVDKWRPRWLAVVGVTAYRAAFGRKDARIGPQADDPLFAPTRVWVLPNPSGLNAHYDLAGLAAEFEQLKIAAER